MASLSKTVQPSQAVDENTRPTTGQTDPFWTTPRSNPSGLTTLMATLQHEIQQSPPVPPRQSKQPVPRLKVPACTHVTMERLYGAHRCHQCGLIPSLGWLYTCRQDNMQSTKKLHAESAETLPTVADDGDYFEAQALVAHSIGMSPSIIKQMRSGAYSFDQVEILLAQRRHVIDTIRRTTNPSTASVPPTPARGNSTGTENIIASIGTTSAPITQHVNTTSLPMTPAGTPNNTPAESTAGTPNKITPGLNPQKPSRVGTSGSDLCTFQVCHSCRPFFQDRVPMSFEPVLNDQMPALGESDMAMLPMMNLDIVRNLGLQEKKPLQPLRRSDESMDITMHRRPGNGYSFSGDDWTPTTGTTNTGSETDSESLEEDELCPCPGNGVCPMWTLDGCAYDLGFNDGDRHVNHRCAHEVDEAQGLGIHDSDHHLRHMPASVASTESTPDRASSQGSSSSLPIPPTTPLTASSESCDGYSPGQARFPRLRSPPSPSNESNSSRGSEVELRGGVALTEEAVGSRTPDIVTNEPYRTTTGGAKA